MDCASQRGKRLPYCSVSSCPPSRPVHPSGTWRRMPKPTPPRCRSPPASNTNSRSSSTAMRPAFDLAGRATVSRSQQLRSCFTDDAESGTSSHLHGHI